jgi:hypothetical protein
MDIQEKIKNKSLLEWAFCWNQLRLVIAGATLILAKQSPILTYLSIPIISPLAMNFMGAAWIISGGAAGYLIYKWNEGGKKVFGGDDKKDVVAFWIAVITGVHLGIAGLTGNNIGFSVVPYEIIVPVMIITGVAYFWSAYHLHKRGGVNALFASDIQTSEQLYQASEVSETRINNEQSDSRNQ